MKEDKTWIKEQEYLFWKKWNENLINLHWKMYKIGKEVDNKNTGLWKQLRKK